MDHTLQVRSVTHNFGERNILSVAEIECRTGEIAVIFGRNGTGKSTLFKILFGMLNPNQLEVYIDGEVYYKATALNKLIAYHPQEIMLPKNMQVGDLMALYLDKEREDKVYHSEGIRPIHHKRVKNLSLGQQRYLQFLLVINLDHHFVLLDEPFSMVEPLYKDLIKQKLNEYKTHKGFLITDHYYRDVLDVADKINLLADGKIIPIADPQELVNYKYLTEQSLT
ncbi:MAG TPA: ATP-binding cassette domain-containing protein [Mucilaginibacter sp.]|jgi:ABC-type multidrug transport system ATPase subunit|nr:ATP-binding cassette domain-containing protein [Mucilaginibacter sp.]